MSSGTPTTRAKATIRDNGWISFDDGVTADKRSCYLEWALTGGASTSVSFLENAGQTATWYWCGDCSAFYGKLILRARDSVTTESNNSVLVISNVTVAGSVEIQKYETLRMLGANSSVGGLVDIKQLAAFEVSGGHTTMVGSLNLDGTLKFVDATSKLQVGGDITIGGSAEIVLPAGINGDILTFPSSAAFSLDDFQAAIERCETNPAVVLKISDNGATKVLTVMNPLAVANRTVDITDDGVMSGANAAYRLNVKEGATLTMVGKDGGSMPVNLQGGSVNIMARKLAEWGTIPLFWLDASDDVSISNVVVIYENSTYNYNAKSPSGCYLKMGSTVTDTAGNPIIKCWVDRRPEKQVYRIWNQRYDELYNGFNAVMAALYPRRIKGGLNGMDYITFDLTPQPFRVTFTDDTTQDVTSQATGNARMFTQDYNAALTVSSSTKSIAPRYAFVVFGSQQGGGDYLLGINSRFVRAGTSKNHAAADPICKDNSIGATVWLDGTEVNPLTTGFNGAWQVVTVDYKSTANGTFSGLGVNDGQNYAEIILVEQELTERQRQSIEIYLAEKWGLQDAYAYPEWYTKDNGPTTVYGTGTVNLQTDARVGGAFKGTINLNGNNLTVDGAALPPGTNALDTTGLEGWYDPDAEGKTREAGPTKLDITVKETGEVIQNGYTILPEMHMIDLLDVVRPKVEGSLHLYGQPQRAPWLNKTVRAYGPARKWMEFSNLDKVDLDVYAKVADGKVLRFSKVNNAGNLDGSTYQQPMRTLFMVQDSLHGGGHPFADGETVNSPKLYKSRTGTASAIGQPIYPAGTADILTKGITCLDGREVNGLTESFGARPEVLTVAPTGTFNVVAIGQLGNSECLVDGHNEVIGEIMIYNRKLEAAERKVVEAYLSYKWLGIANEGYSALSDATVTGAGTVTAASAALLPKFGAGFTGTVSVPIPSEGFAFTLKGGEVVGALDFGGGTFTASGEIKVTVSVEGTRQAGSFRLIGWGAKPAGVTFDLVSDDIPEKYRTRRVEDDGLWLDVRKAGTVLIIK